MTATFPATEGRQNEFKLKSFCRQYVQWFAKRLCVVDLPSLCICRDTDPGGILEELTSYTVFHLTYLFVCSLNHPLHNMQCAWRKKKQNLLHMLLDRRICWVVAPAVEHSHSPTPDGVKIQVFPSLSHRGFTGRRAGSLDWPTHAPTIGSSGHNLPYNGRNKI